MTAAFLIILCFPIHCCSRPFSGFWAFDILGIYASHRTLFTEEKSWKHKAEQFRVRISIVSEGTVQRAPLVYRQRSLVFWAFGCDKNCTESSDWNPGKLPLAIPFPSRSNENRQFFNLDPQFFNHSSRFSSFGAPALSM